MNTIRAKQPQKPPLKILLIENDAATAALTALAFEEAGLQENITNVRNGEQALEFLRKAAPADGEAVHNMIFLDLHLPRISGLEVLKEIKTNPKWLATPVVVVSGSADPVEIRKAYELHASCYVQKPSDLDQFLSFAKACYLFWGQIVTLPSGPRHAKPLRNEASDDAL